MVAGATVLALVLLLQLCGRTPSRFGMFGTPALYRIHSLRRMPVRSVSWLRFSRGRTPDTISSSTFLVFSRLHSCGPHGSCADAATEEKAAGSTRGVVGRHLA